jgi:hypothetical protein
MTSESEEIGLYRAVMADSGFFSGPLILGPKDRTMITGSMKRSGGAVLAWATLGWLFHTRNQEGHLDITEPWLYPERYAEHGRRWCVRGRMQTPYPWGN